MWECQCSQKPEEGIRSPRTGVSVANCSVWVLRMEPRSPVRAVDIAQPSLWSQMVITLSYNILWGGPPFYIIKLLFSNCHHLHQTRKSLKQGK